nr:Imm61 family immunity protein [Mycobacterium avium]
MDLTSDLQAWIRLAGLDTVQGSETNDGRTIIWNQGGESRYFIDFADNWYIVNSSDRRGPKTLTLREGRWASLRGISMGCSVGQCGAMIFRCSKRRLNAMNCVVATA